MKRKNYIVAFVLLGVIMLGVLLVQAGNGNFTASLSGDNEVPANNSKARGQAIFKFSDDNSSMYYKLIVANIENVVAAHIHCATTGVSGPVGVNLFVGGSPGSGAFNGVLATAIVSDPNSGNSCGWTSLHDVRAAIESGSAYVNVHTNDGIAPTNTGPGDIASGEIRGQIK